MCKFLKYNICEKSKHLNNIKNKYNIALGEKKTRKKNWWAGFQLPDAWACPRGPSLKSVFC